MFSLRSVSHLYEVHGDADAGIQGVAVDELDISATGITAIMGPSGSGKSTLLSILAGFLRPQIDKGGYLRFDGKDMSRDGHRPGDIAFVFQSPMLLGAANSAANMLQGRVAAQSAETALPLRETRKLLRTLGLLDRGHTLLAKRARLLSGGEAQRFAVMRALLTGARVILCDEPTSNLDQENADAVMKAIWTWSRAVKRPVIWITHDMELAAQYAESYVFLSGGRIARPDSKTARGLGANRYSRRLAALQAFMRRLGSRRMDDRGNEADHDAAPIDVDRATFGHWVAHALSTDARGAERTDTACVDALAPRGLQRLISRIDPGFPVPSGHLRDWVKRLACFARHYSRYGLTIVMTVLLAQVFLAIMLGSTAELYSETRLQDPAVARIVFEHDALINAARGGGGNAEDLYAATTLDDIGKDIRTGLTKLGAPPADLARVKVFGRRSVDQSAIRFPQSDGRCERWIPLDTVALDRKDPLLHQTVLAEDEGASLVKDTELLARRAAERAKTDGQPGIAILDARTMDRLRTKCGLKGDGPVKAEWAALAGGRNDPFPLEIMGVAQKMPPLYPSPVQLLVFEQDVQYLANRGSANLWSFRIATAYFPIDGFDTVESVLRDRNYVIRDDSEAAVRTLQQTAYVARWLPLWIALINMIGVTCVIALVLIGILDLNKRVLALFRAYGFTRGDMLRVMLWHLAPAVLFALAALFLSILAAWPELSAWVPRDLGALEPLRNTAFLQTALFAIVITLVSIVVITTAWWRSMTGRFTKYLQE